MGSCLGASCTTGRAVSYGPRVRACARDGFCSPPPLWGSKRQPLFHGGKAKGCLPVSETTCCTVQVCSAVLYLRPATLFAGAGRRHGAHGLLHARDDRLRPPQGHQGTYNLLTPLQEAISVAAAFYVCVCLGLTPLQIALKLAGTEPPGADPGRRHVVRRRAPEDQPVSQPALFFPLFEHRFLWSLSPPLHAESSRDRIADGARSPGPCVLTG
jgi:hypothetical protein